MGRSRKTWEECVKDDMKLLGLQLDEPYSVQRYVEGLHACAKR